MHTFDLFYTALLFLCYHPFAIHINLTSVKSLRLVISMYFLISTFQFILTMFLFILHCGDTWYVPKNPDSVFSAKPVIHT